MAWTEDRVETLRSLWAEGATAAEIAKALGNVSRNAVIGKAHRLGLSNRAAAPKGADTEPEEPKELVKPSPKKKTAVKGAAAEEAKSGAEEKKKVKAKAKAAEPAPAKAEPKAAAETTKAEQAKEEALRKALENVPDPEELDEMQDETDEDAINPILALAAEAERNSRKLSLLELNERTCKWPIGDPSTDDFYFCGLPCAPEKPYCSAHVQLAYQPMSSRRDRDRERSRARAASA